MFLLAVAFKCLQFCGYCSVYYIVSIAGLQFIDNMCQYIVINCLCIRTPPIKVIRFGKSSILKIGYKRDQTTCIKTFARTHTLQSRQTISLLFGKCIESHSESLVELVSLLADIMRNFDCRTFPPFFSMPIDSL